MPLSKGENTDQERHRLVRKLESIAKLQENERQALLELPITIRTYGPDQDIFRDGDRPSECCLILEGFAFRYKLLADGRRQILAFHTPGDIPDLQSLHLKVIDHSLGTLVRTRTALISLHDLRALCRQYPGLAAVLWRDTLIDAAMFREWMVGLGRRSAHERIAHLLCEMTLRLAAVGLSDSRSCDLPITQLELGDALGLTAVHVNRVLQDLRRDGVIVLSASRLIVLDWQSLRAIANFDPTYLHQDPPKEAV
jgi:CRP-like cAMP-binding protein